MSILAKRRIRNAAKKLGFYDLGNFLIGRHTEDVISGFAIDATPRAVYVWTFILPRFDDLSFLHMSLGERVIDVNESDYPIEEALRNVWGAIKRIGTAEELISYLEDHKIVGEYAVWTRFLSLINLGQFDRAERMLDIIATLSAASIPSKLKELLDAKQYGGWPAVQDLLNEWAGRTNELVARVPLET